MDLWIVPASPKLKFPLYLLSGILDHHNHPAGNLLLFCKEKSTQNHSEFMTDYLSPSYSLTYCNYSEGSIPRGVLACFLPKSRAVSYTHLDVYKRQGLYY